MAVLMHACVFVCCLSVCLFCSCDWQVAGCSVGAVRSPPIATGHRKWTCLLRYDNPADAIFVEQPLRLWGFSWSQALVAGIPAQPCCARSAAPAWRQRGERSALAAPCVCCMLVCSCPQPAGRSNGRLRASHPAARHTTTPSRSPSCCALWRACGGSAAVAQGGRVRAGWLGVVVYAAEATGGLCQGRARGPFG